MHFLLPPKKREMTFCRANMPSYGASFTATKTASLTRFRLAIPSCQVPLLFFQKLFFDMFSYFFWEIAVDAWQWLWRTMQAIIMAHDRFTSNCIAPPLLIQTQRNLDFKTPMLRSTLFLVFLWLMYCKPPLLYSLEKLLHIPNLN